MEKYREWRWDLNGIIEPSMIASPYDQYLHILRTGTHCGYVYASSYEDAENLVKHMTSNILRPKSAKIFSK